MLCRCLQNSEDLPISGTDGIRGRQMASNKEIEAGAKAIAKDLALPGGGRKKLARVLEDHLDWFEAVETRGLTWNDMTRLLFAAGAKGRGGRPISIGTLSSAVWRKRRQAQAPVPAARTPTKTRATPAQRGLRKRADDPIVKPRDLPPSPAVANKPSKISIKRRLVTGSALPATQDSSKAEARKPPKTEPASGAETLAFMKRAAAIRRGRNE